MQFQKKETAEGTFAKKGEDIKDGDIVTILDEGKKVEGQYGEQNIFKVGTASGEFLVSLNQTSINSIVDEFGEDSAKWVNEQVKVISAKMMVSGKMRDVYYFAPEGYTLGENGLEKEGSQVTSDNIPF